MDNIKISIIIPVYNAEKYINACIESVQRQLLKELEIICIDDGSDDNTVQKIISLQESDERILLLTQVHGGAGKARNYGISAARGEYIAFLDADDIFCEEDALERMTDACGKHGTYICGSYLRMITDGIAEEGELFRDVKFPNEEGRLFTFQEFQEDYFYQCFIFQREFLINHHITFPDYLRYQDPPFFLNAMVEAGSFWVVPVTLYGYRYGHQNEKNIARKIKYVLMGIQDTLQIAVNNDYAILYEKIITRIDVIFYEKILSGLSDEVMSLLLEINRINNTYYKAKPIRLMRDIYGHYEKFRNLKESFVLMNKIVKIQQSREGFKKFFLNKGITQVIVYGLGMYGKILINALEQNGVEIVCCIDKKVEKYEQYIIIKPDDKIPHADAVIVSPVQAGEIVSYCQRKKMENVITFRQIIEELAED